MGHRRQAWIIAAVVTAVLLPVSSTAARTYEPTRRDDPAPGRCKRDDCSLREALKAANGTPDRDTVLLRGGTYELEIPHEGAALNSGSFDLVDGVTLRGRGAGRTTIDANDLDQVMTGWANLGPDSFALKALTLTGGDAEPGSQNDGGAVIVGPEDTLTLSRVRIVNNRAPTSGGGVAAFGETTIRRSVITENQATVGGGIESTASGLTVKQTTVAGNTAVEGGGLDLRPGPELPVTKVLSSTISGNTATNKAGGILADGNPYAGGDYPDEPDLGVVNSTIAGNRANNDAGGVMGDNEAKIDIENSSIGLNTANFDDIGTAKAGGIYQHSNASFSVDDSVLASNAVGQGGSDPDCSATQVFSGAGNVISSMDGCSVSFTTPFNAYSAATIANDLADNGGPTETMRVPNGSAAIRFANECPRRDQRGEVRPRRCDSGSFENRPRR